MTDKNQTGMLIIYIIALIEILMFYLAANSSDEDSSDYSSSDEESDEESDEAR